MFSRRRLLQALQPCSPSACFVCPSRTPSSRLQSRPLSSTTPSLNPTSAAPHTAGTESSLAADQANTASGGVAGVRVRKVSPATDGSSNIVTKTRKQRKRELTKQRREQNAEAKKPERPQGKTLREAMLAGQGDTAGTSAKKLKKKKGGDMEHLPIEILTPQSLDFESIQVEIPPVPRLAYGLDRVLFNAGVYRLRDLHSRVYNFDPYLEKIMPVDQFDFDALSEYKTSSKDEDLLTITRQQNTKFTGSTSSMSAVLQHFHYLISNFRGLNHSMLSRKFPDPSPKFSKITLGPDAILLRWKNGIYAVDADKSYDKPNIMSWLGHSLEKLLTSKRDTFERYRRSSPEKAPSEDASGRCYHYSKQGNFLMRSQLDAYDPRLPRSGVFDLKTRAVVSIRMNHKEFEDGSGYQLRYDLGEWQSYEREFYDMTRATMLKYSLQVRMGRMDGIFIAYHNIERLFGFQYLSLPDMDNVLHGQHDRCLGDQEFKLSIRLLDELLQRATEKFPETSLRLHFEARNSTTPFMYIFAEPVTEEQAEEIQQSGRAAQKEFERNIVGVNRDDPEVQAEWQAIQDRVDEEVDDDEMPKQESNEVQQNTNDPTEKGETVHEANSTPTPQDRSEEGPLMGWTLTVRNRVNGKYVPRPEELTDLDEWSLEYHIKEIDPSACWRPYTQVKNRRRNLIGLDDDEVAAHTANYRKLIKKYTEMGRKWRQKEDKIDERSGPDVYRPLGPGSEAAQEAAVEGQ